MRPTTTVLDVFVLLGLLLAALVTSSLVGLAAAKVYDWFTREEHREQL